MLFISLQNYISLKNLVKSWIFIKNFRISLYLGKLCCNDGIQLAWTPRVCQVMLGLHESLGFAQTCAVVMQLFTSIFRLMSSFVMKKTNAKKKRILTSALILFNSTLYKHRFFAMNPQMW